MKNEKGSNQPPIQKLPRSKKNQEWKESNIDYFISRYDINYTDGTSRKERMKIAYDLYNSIFNENDFKYVTDPFKVRDGFPATIQNFNIIKPKIDLLIGEETKRPYSYKVIQVNEDATSKLQEKYKQLVTTSIVNVAREGSPDQPVTDEELQQIEDLGKYINHDYSDLAETVAYHTLEYLNEKENIRDKFVKGFKDGLISGMEVIYVGILNSEPVLERVNPLYFSYDSRPDVEFIEDGDWAVRRIRMSVSSIYERLYDVMTESELDTLIEKFDFANHNSKKSGADFNRIVWKNFDQSSFNDEFDTEAIDVYHVTWRSLAKVGFLTYFDENGEEQTEVVDENYVPLDEEEVTWDWVTEIWEGYKVGDDMYLAINPIPNQYVSIDNPNDQKLPYVGAVFNNDNSKSKSLVEIMKPLQYMYL
ncbi:MAG TPA: hypothetical protein VK982_16005, partial [Bacteroidales bacterium]|nr:hypothetical protein [Bacteroidales bacterium]